MSCRSPARRRSRSSRSRQPERLADQHAVGRDAARVTGGERRLRVDHVGERLADAVERRLVGDARRAPAGRGRAPARPGRRARRASHSGSSSRDREEAAATSRREPAAAALAHHRARRRAAAARRRRRRPTARAPRCAPAARSRALEPPRVALAVPVLVELEDGLGRRLGAAERAHDRGAAVAARLDDLRARRRQLAQHGQRPPRPRQPGAAVDVLRGVAHDVGRPLPVDELAVRLQRDVVGPEQPAHARGRRRAADVLEQRRHHQRVAVRRRPARARRRRAARSGTCARRARPAGPRSGRARARARRAARRGAGPCP